MNAHLSIFTRFPAAGESKTRLIPALGAEGAASVQLAMTEHVVRQARIASATDGVSIEARVTGGTAAECRRWLGVRCVAQGAGDLGERLERALADGLRRRRVAAVLGGDCPSVDADDIRVALRAAAEHGAAMIPASDGGFCLLALATTVATPGLLRGVPWGTEDVAEQTLAALGRAGLTARLLPERADVDTPDDLAGWERTRIAWREPPRTLSVVIPTLNEAESLPRLLAALACEPVEVVVADGGSTDGTPEIAGAAGALVVTDETGRGAQMNAGGRAATGDALLFLHADARPEAGFTRSALDALADPRLLVGAFRFALDATSPLLRVLEAGTRLRGSALHLPYGDQGLFCRAAVWRALGGFPALRVMEDYEFVRRARRVGRVRVIGTELPTSARRWQEQGALRWTALNLGTVARYHLGATPEQLAEWRSRHSKR